MHVLISYFINILSVYSIYIYIFDTKIYITNIWKYMILVIQLFIFITIFIHPTKQYLIIWK